MDFERLELFSGSGFHPKVDRLFKKSLKFELYPEIKRKWLGRIKDNNVKTKKLLDFYFERLYPCLKHFVVADR